MNLIEELDNINKFGYRSYLSWDYSFTISYIDEEKDIDIDIVTFSYKNDLNSTYLEYLDYTIDLFYKWYFKNNNIFLENVDFTPKPVYGVPNFSEFTLGDISKKIKRELNINKLL